MPPDSEYKDAVSLCNGLRAELEMLKIEAEKIENERSDIRAYVRLASSGDF
jgi:predicted  nucleic acid-binding Zn-ribbon protein